MRKGRDIQTIAVEVQDTRDRKDDWIFPGPKLRLGESGENLIPTSDVYDGSPFLMTDVSHGCLARRLEIPKPYYDRMRSDAPQLLAENVNKWLDDSPRHLIRTLMGDLNNPSVCRAILSERYKIIDNDDLMERVFPVLQDQPGMEVLSTEITPTRFYLKATFPQLKREIKLNDPVQAGVVISNSEVGHGSTSVALLVYRLRCLNGMILADDHFKMRRTHLGGVLETDNDFRIAASSDTERLADEAFVSGLNDIVRMAADPEIFAEICDKLMATTMQHITGNVEETVERVTKRFQLSETEGTSVLEHLIRDGDYSKWGVANAVTRTAEDVESYDRTTELEKLGGDVIDLRLNEWTALAA
tara:strand:- start:7027 stop:8100 length:1074 start_codon:yes stop_codon:yes gene_type:complete